MYCLPGVRSNDLLARVSRNHITVVGESIFWKTCSKFYFFSESLQQELQTFKIRGISRSNYWFITARTSKLGQVIAEWNPRLRRRTFYDQRPLMRKFISSMVDAGIHLISKLCWPNGNSLGIACLYEPVVFWAWHKYYVGQKEWSEQSL